MEPNPKPVPAAERDRWNRAEAAYAIALFVAAAGALAIAIAGRGEVLPDHGPAVALFFLGYGLFTISIGYRHPNLGYYSFDRVAQIASMLVLGPVDAAWINGLASLLYPWHRLFKGVALRNVVYAALTNSGLMTLIILASGTLYAQLGGAYPLIDLSGNALVALVALVLAMQLLNDLGMLALLKLGRRSLSGFFNSFSYGLELGAGATAVLVAIVYNTSPTSVFALLLVVLSIGMLALQQFANMRQALEVIVAERTQSLREKTLELERQATRDNLTDLYNRRYADEYVAQQFENASRHRQCFSVAMGDIDLFKQINDLHSHAKGDAVLRRVADILRARCRAIDMVARYGGEEFLICFPHTDLQQARALCEALRAAVENGNWSQLGLAAGVTISFGIAEYRTDLSPDRLLNAADVQLYAAKNAGRNLVVA
jgi:diguanylate cyclase (GGDEF)-like protein